MDIKANTPMSLVEVIKKAAVPSCRLIHFSIHFDSNIHENITSCLRKSKLYVRIYLTQLQYWLKLASLAWFRCSSVCIWLVFADNNKRKIHQLGTVMSCPPAGFIMFSYWVKHSKGLASEGLWAPVGNRELGGPHYYVLIWH